MSEARAAAFAAHAAARDADQGSDRYAARAAGHAAHVANYAVKAVSFASAAVLTDLATAIAGERDWQHRRLPKHLRPLAAVQDDN
jgi:hypothetical protein